MVISPLSATPAFGGVQLPQESLHVAAH
jgi:hypothetical protein